MEILIYVIVIFVVSISLKLLVTAFAGAKSVREFELKETMVECRNGRLSDTFIEVGVTIIVTNLQSKGDLSRLLSLDLLGYEVVVVMDCDTNSLADSLIQDYALLEADAVPRGELACASARRVLRSTRGHFSRLVVVDLPSDSNYKMYNCGVNVARYEYVVAFDAGVCTLNSGAVCSVVREIMELPFESKPYAVGGFRVGRLPYRSLAIVDVMVRMIVGSAGFARLSRLGANLGIARTKQMGVNRSLMIVFDRDSLLEVGGYKTEDDADFDLYQRIKLAKARRQSRMEAVFVAKVFLFDSSVLGFSRNVILDGQLFNNMVLTKSFTLIFLLLLSFSFALCEVYALSYFANLLGLILVLLYCVCLSVSLVAMSVSRKLMLESFGYRHTLKLLVSLLFYPFYWVFMLIKSN